MACVLPEQNDTELTDDEIVRRVNDELVAVWGNLVNRVVSMIGRNFDGAVPASVDPQPADIELVATVDRTLTEVAASIEGVELRAALRAAMSAAQAANAYLSDNEPWKVVKTDRDRAGTVLHHALQAVAGINVALSPFIPFAERVGGRGPRPAARRPLGRGRVGPRRGRRRTAARAPRPPLLEAGLAALRRTDLSAWVVAGIGAAVLLAAITQQVSGFGYALLAVPLLSILVGPKDAVAIATVSGATASALMAVRLRALADRPTLRACSAARVVGMPIGIIGLRELPEDPLRVALAVVVLAMVVVLASGYRFRSRRPGTQVVAGFASGLLNTSIGTAGPPVVRHAPGRDRCPSTPSGRRPSPSSPAATSWPCR